jgi:hypothetical protein
MADDITSLRLTAVQTQRLPEEPETIFLMFHTLDGEAFTFHLRVWELAQIAAQMDADSKGRTN